MVGGLLQAAARAARAQGARAAGSLEGLDGLHSYAREARLKDYIFHSCALRVGGWLEGLRATRVRLTWLCGPHDGHRRPSFYAYCFFRSTSRVSEIKVYVSHIDLPYTCRTPFLVSDDVGAERDYVPKDYMSYARSVVKQSVRDVSCNGVCDS